MSQENVEIVRKLYSAFNARDVEAMTELADPDVEWIPDSRVGHGPIRASALREKQKCRFHAKAEVRS
jgi:ketosteroid isomerase-like protein